MTTPQPAVQPAPADVSRRARGVMVIAPPYMRMLALLAAIPFVIDALVHAINASSYDPTGGGLITEGNLFRAEAVAAGVIALLLLVRPTRVAWMAALAVAATALAAVVLYRYVDVGAIGPIPNLYEPTWVAPGKLLSAVAEAFAVLISGVGLAMSSASKIASTAT